MGKLVRFEVQDQPRALVVGKEIRASMEEQAKGNNLLPALWDKCFAENAFAPLEAQADFIIDDAYIGIMLDFGLGDGNFTYIVGMLLKEGATVPESYVSRTLEPCKVAVSWIQGNDTGDVCSAAHELTQKALQEAGHTCERMQWCMELYNCPRFTTPDENGQIILDYYIPLD